MATAPLLMLIVAALPRAEAAPVPASELTAPAAVVVRAAVLHRFSQRLSQPGARDDEQARAPVLAIAPAGETKRPAREPLVQALVLLPSWRGVAPALAPRTEPGDARGPPASRV